MKQYTDTVLSARTALPIAGATVTVIVSATGQLAPLYQTNNTAGAVFANPFTVNGTFRFFAPDNRYDFIVNSFGKTITLPGVDIYDLADMKAAANRLLQPGPPGQDASQVGMYAQAQGMAIGGAIKRITLTDRLSPTFKRVAAMPAHLGRFRSLDRLLPDGLTVDAANGGWWELDVVDVYPDHFGAIGDNGTTSDVAALVALAQYINIKGGGNVKFRPNAVYSILNNQTMQNPPTQTYYTFPPTVQYIIEIANCTKPVCIDMQGATIRNFGGRYGVFNTDGTPKATALGYVGVGASTPYYAMIYLHDNTGGGYIRNGVTDGNIGSVLVGGFFSDAGIQLEMDGLSLSNNKPAISDDNMRHHHHGRDGFIVSHAAASRAAPKCGYHSRGSKAYNNGRNNCSHIGGRGSVFSDFEWYQAAKGCVGLNGVAVITSPASGLDIEAENENGCYDVVLEDGQAYDCYNQGVVADSGDTVGITLRRVTVIGNTNYSVWLNKPEVVLDACKIVGTATHLFADPVNPSRSFKAINTTFTDEVAASNDGNVFSVNDLLIEGGVNGNDFTRCTFIKSKTAGTGGAGNAGGPLYIDCTFICYNGVLNCNGKFQGQGTRFVQAANNCFLAVPGGRVANMNDAGVAYDPWTFRDFNGTVTPYPATVDKRNNALGSFTIGDTDKALAVGTAGTLQVCSTPLTANRTVTITGGREGAEFLIVRTSASTGASTLTVAGKALATGQWALVKYVVNIGMIVVAAGSL